MKGDNISRGAQQPSTHSPKRFFRRLGRNGGKGYPRRSPLILLLLIVLWAIGLGWGMALAIDSSSVLDITKVSQNNKSVDSVPESYQLGQRLYLENCSSCHIPIPPEVLPTDAWRSILVQTKQHYGQQLPPLLGISRRLIWNYLSSFSRPLLENEPKPTYVENSRYFRALHPQVDLPNPVTHQTCLSCHPGAKQFEYLTLAPEWEN